MTRTRGPQFSLQQALGSPAFTPRRGDADALIDLVLRGEAAESAVAQALARIGPAAFERLAARLPQAELRGSARATLVRLLGRLTRAEEPDELQTLLALTRDADPPAARNAIAGLGRLTAAAHAIEPALLALWHERPRPEDRRALAETLGKLGGAPAQRLLGEALAAADQDAGSDPLLRQVLGRAVLRLERTALRPAAPGVAEQPTIADTVALPGPREVTLLCRAGLTAVLVEELRARRLSSSRSPVTIAESERIGEPGQVTLRWSGSLGELLAARTCTELALPLAAPARARAAATLLSTEELVEAATAALTDPQTVQTLRALTRGPLRYRVHFTSMGHRRALVWRIAEAVASRCRDLCNDPTDSPWELRIEGSDSAPGPLRLLLVPRQLPDPRFAYRCGDVPAASHPTLAAALARLCAARSHDVVWDPFVGSGSELIEVALLANDRRDTLSLYGSDLSEAALATTAQNAAAAAIAIELRLADALGPPPPGLTRIVTNPPMGRRVRRGDATELLASFAAHAARVLPAGGQLAWIAPQPQRTAPILSAGGLTLTRAHAIDMNGFWARLEVWTKP